MTWLLGLLVNNKLARTIGLALVAVGAAWAALQAKERQGVQKERTQARVRDVTQSNDIRKDVGDAMAKDNSDLSGDELDDRLRELRDKQRP